MENKIMENYVDVVKFTSPFIIGKVKLYGIGFDKNTKDILLLTQSSKPPTVRNLNEAKPQPVDQFCYDCGQRLFEWDNAYRCIYCGCHTEGQGVNE